MPSIPRGRGRCATDMDKSQSLAFRSPDPAIGLVDRHINRSLWLCFVLVGGVRSLSQVRLCDPMDCSTPGFPVLHQASQSLLKLMSTELMMPSNHLILCHPLLFLPSIFPSISVFSYELALCIRWPNYWSFSFSIIPSKEIPGLISFRMDWLDLLAV